MNAATTTTTLRRINARLTTPISRQLFEQSIRPLMAQRGEAELDGARWLFDGAAVSNWATYLVWREAQIEAGLLPWRSQYSTADMEACAQATGAKI